MMTLLTTHLFFTLDFLKNANKACDKIFEIKNVR